MKTAVISGAVVLILLLDLFASTRLLRSQLHTPSQKAAWLLLVWAVPVVGAILALRVSAESNTPVPSAKRELGSQVWPPGIGPDNDDGSSGGHAG